MLLVVSVWFGTVLVRTGPIPVRYDMAWFGYGTVSYGTFFGSIRCTRQYGSVTLRCVALRCGPV